MAAETKTKEIDGLTFAVTQMPGRKASDLNFRLMGKLLPAVTRAGSGFGALNLADALGGGNVDAGKVLEGIGSAAASLFSDLTPEEFQRMSKELCAFSKVTTEDGNELPMSDSTIDMVFAGKTGTFYKFLVFAIEANFANFGSALADLFRQGMVRAKLSRPISPPPGHSGG